MQSMQYTDCGDDYPLPCAAKDSYAGDKPCTVWKYMQSHLLYLSNACLRGWHERLRSTLHDKLLTIRKID